MKSILSDRKKIIVNVLLGIGLLTAAWSNGYAQRDTLVFDVGHGQNPAIAAGYNELFGGNHNTLFSVHDGRLDAAVLRGKAALVIFSPRNEFQPAEIAAVTNYLKGGGSLLLIFDEERRTPLSQTRINELIVPFGLELTGDTPVRHNCGAVAEKGDVCSAAWELPYSGGRSVKGGTVISRVYDDGDYIHSAYTNTPNGGKIIVMSDGMAGLLLGRPDGVRFSGTGPADSSYWGKDSEAFIREIVAFLLK